MSEWRSTTSRGGRKCGDPPRTLESLPHLLGRPGPPALQAQLGVDAQVRTSPGHTPLARSLAVDRLGSSSHTPDNHLVKVEPWKSKVPVAGGTGRAARATRGPSPGLHVRALVGFPNIHAALARSLSGVGLNQKNCSYHAGAKSAANPSQLVWATLQTEQAQAFCARSSCFHPRKPPCLIFIVVMFTAGGASRVTFFFRVANYLRYSEHVSGSRPEGNWAIVFTFLE
jgi:hypothetical protein